MTVRSALARLHTRSVYGSLDLFGTFCGNAKKYIKEYYVYNVSRFYLLNILMSLFLLAQKK
jgi:hypothetical protein